MKWKTYKVESIDQLNMLSATLKPKLMRKYRSLEFFLPDKSEEENKKISEDLNGNYRACGCLEGTVLGMAFLIFYAINSIANRDAGFQWQQMAFGIGFLFAGVTLGKLLGILWNHIRLKNKLKNIVLAYGTPSQDDPPKKDDVHCAVGRR